MDNKWTYQKDNPNLPLENTAAPAHISASPTESLGITKTIEAEYRKKEPTEFPQSYIVIFSGGKKTEAQYFTIIQENKAVFPRIRIDFLAEDRFDKGTESIKFIPRIFSYAFNKLEEYKQGASPDNPDSYYLVSDIDHFKDAIIAYKSQCEKCNLQLIVSNPCFEVWLYYSKHADKLISFKEPENESSLSHQLKKFVNSSIPGGLNPVTAIFDIEQNIINARLNYQCDSNGIPKKYSTDMFILAQDILPFIIDELMKYQRNQHR